MFRRIAIFLLTTTLLLGLSAGVASAATENYTTDYILPKGRPFGGSVQTVAWSTTYHKEGVTVGSGTAKTTWTSLNKTTYGSNSVKIVQRAANLARAEMNSRAGHGTTLAALTVDGDYGAKTAALIKVIQKDRIGVEWVGLGREWKASDCDGAVGKNTWFYILKGFVD